MTNSEQIKFFNGHRYERLDLKNTKFVAGVTVVKWLAPVMSNHPIQAERE